MKFNTEISDLFSVSPNKDFGVSEIIDPNYIRTEIVKNPKNKSELQFIYHGETVTIKLKQKGEIKTYVGFDLQSANRIKKAWKWEAEDELIAIVNASSENLSVMGCDLNVWEVPFSALPCIDKIPISERTEFELDEDGSYLYWECADIHLDLEDVKAAVDPEFKEKLLLEKQKYGESFGKAISLVRRDYQLKQKDIDGVSERHIRRIEKEGHQPTLNTLKKLAAAHNLNLESYLEKINEKLKENSKSRYSDTKSD